MEIGDQAPHDAEVEGRGGGPAAGDAPVSGRLYQVRREGKLDSDPGRSGPSLGVVLRFVP